MTEQELTILKMLSEVHEEFMKLPVLYADPKKVEQHEIHSHINSLHLTVLAREGMRAYKKVFTLETVQDLEQDTKEDLQELNHSEKVNEEFSRFKTRLRNLFKKHGVPVQEGRYGTNVELTPEFKKLLAKQKSNPGRKKKNITKKPVKKSPPKKRSIKK